MRATRTHVLHFSAPVQDVFPLFTPIHEKRWAQGWNPLLIHSESPTAEEKGAVFTTQHPGDPLAVWTITAYDPVEHRITYVKFVPEQHITLIEIVCVAGEKTAVHVTYTLTALTEAGHHIVQGFTEAHFHHHMMAAWQYAIDRCLETGSST